jgi:N-acetyltransferase
MKLEPFTLENDFVRLDPLEERHREPLREAGNDPDLWTFANFNLNNTNFDEWMGHRLKEISTTADLTWAVFDKASQSYAGSTSYLAVVLAHKRLEIGWTWYAKRVWAGAVNPSCKYLLMRHGFEQLALNRIEY